MLVKIYIFTNRELKKCQIETVNDANIENCAICEINDTDNDEVIAHMMQDQFNKEYDLMLKRTEEKFNRDSKGKMFFLINFISNFMTFVSYSQYNLYKLPNFSV